jgi:AcrR family transcriptional regulator
MLPLAGTHRPPRAAAAPPDTARPDRRAAILLAAERLFALHGYHAVSIRDIADEAGVPSALVGYYFGPKDELFHAIVMHWRGTVDARLDGLRTALRAPPSRRLRAILRAFVEPVLALRASAEGEYYALLVARELFHRRPETERALTELFDPMAQAFVDALHEVLPGTTRGQAAWAYQFALGALLHHISDDRVERLSHGQNRRSDPAAAPLLLDFIVGGIRAALHPRRRP